MFSTYILKSKLRDWYYVGHAIDPEDRLGQHNAGYNRSTKPYRPFVVVYREDFETKREAFKREQQIKRYRHGEAFRKMIGV